MSETRHRRMVQDLRDFDRATPDHGDLPRTALQRRAADRAARLLVALNEAALLDGDTVRVHGTRYRLSVIDDDIKTVEQRTAASVLLADAHSVFAGRESGEGVTAPDDVCARFLEDYAEIAKGFARIAVHRLHRELFPEAHRSRLQRVAVRCAVRTAAFVERHLPALHRVAAPCVVRIRRTLSKPIVVRGVAENFAWGIAAGVLAAAPMLVGVATGLSPALLIGIGVATATAVSNQRVIDVKGLRAKQRQYDRLREELGPERRLKAVIALADHAADAAVRGDIGLAA